MLGLGIYLFEYSVRVLSAGIEAILFGVAISALSTRVVAGRAGYISFIKKLSHTKTAVGRVLTGPRQGPVGTCRALQTVVGLIRAALALGSAGLAYGDPSIKIA